MVKDARGHTLRLLLDTNIVVAHEADSIEDAHINAGATATLIRTARDLGFELLVLDGYDARDVARAAPRQTEDLPARVDEEAGQGVTDDAGGADYQGGVRGGGLIPPRLGGAHNRGAAAHWVCPISSER